MRALLDVLKSFAVGVVVVSILVGCVVGLCWLVFDANRGPWAIGLLTLVAVWGIGDLLRETWRRS